MDAACNFPELLALDLDSAESLFSSKRMTAGAPRPMDAVFESQSIQDLGLDLNQLNLNLNDLSLEEASSILNSLGNLSKLTNLNNAAALAHASSHRSLLPGKTSSSRQSSCQDHSRSKSTTHAAPSDLSSYLRQYQRQQRHNDDFGDDDNDSHHRLDQRPTTATGIDRGHSPGPIFSISCSKTKPSGPQQATSQLLSGVPRYAAVTGTSAATHNHTHGYDITGEWDTDSVDSFELPNIRLSRRSGGGGVSAGASGVSKAGPVSSPVQSVRQRIQQQEEEQIQHLQQLQQLKQLRQLQQLKQQLQEKQQLQHLLEKQLKLQHEQEQKLKAGHQESHREQEKEKHSQKQEQSRPKELKGSARKEQSGDTPSHFPQQPPTHLPAHTTSPAYTSLFPQQQQHRLSIDPPSEYGSRDSYGSLYDSYNYNHHRYSHDSNHSANTNTNTDDGASSIAGGGGGGGGRGPRGRQQSVITMATSVTSCGGGGPGCRFSSQSARTTPSALGQYANTKNGGLAVSSQRESVATTASSGDRHVEFSLDTSRRGSTKATSDNTSDGNDDAAGDVLVTSADNDKKSHHDNDAIVADRPQSSGKSPGRRVGNVSQSSWMRFDDDEEEEEEEDDADGDQTYSDIIKGMNGVNSTRSLFRCDSAVDRSRAVVSPVNHDSLPPRPKTAVGHLDGASATDFRALNDYVAEHQTNKKPQSRVIADEPAPDEPAPATSINVPQRRSSLGHQDRNALLFRDQEHIEQQHNAHNHSHQHKLRHFLSFSDASVFSDAPRGGRADALYDRPRTSSSSHYQMQPDFGVTTHRSRFDTDSIADREDPPVFLQKTVYRKPVPRPRTPLEMTPIKKTTHKSTPSEHVTRRGREVFSVSRGSAKDDVNSDSHNNGAQTFAEPLLSQFDDDSDSDHHAGATSDHDDDNDIDNHLAENDAELFGDFEGAYNYDEGEDKIMLATMMPFSKQPPRSVRSIRSVSPGRPLDTLPDRHERPAIASVAALTENPEETSSHLQSWIEHASKSQLELVQQQQQQQHGRSSTSRIQEAFYQDDEQDEDEARDVVAAAIEAPTARQRTAHHDTASTASSTAAAPSSQYELQKALQEAQPAPLQFFSQPGTMGIPLPREVVDTLRVSVSCFPETMLSLSSFSIQTIRTYSRKVRRCSLTDADSTYRLLMSPTSPGLLPPSPTPMAHGVPPMSPTSPTTSMSFDLGTGVSRSMTATSLTSNTSRRFWKLPKKIANNTRAATPNLHLFTNFRSSSSSNNNSYNGNGNNGYPMSPTMGMSPSMPRLSSSGRRGSSRTDNNLHSSSGGSNGEDNQQGKATGLSLKRIFPTGSDYLCDALYAHIIAFNYISMLCPPLLPPATEGTSAEADATASDTQATTEPVTAAHTMTTLASSATLFETAQQQRRQTIRVYVGSDVPLPAMSDIGPSSHDHMMRPLQLPLMELDEIHTNANTSRLFSMSSSRPPSRGYNTHDDNDDGRMISRKAALLLGIAETLEPDTASIGPSISNGHAKKLSTASGAASEFSSALPASLRSSSLARRYNSMRRRMAQSISESAAASAVAAPDPNDHTFASRAARAAAASKMIIKSLPSSMGGNSKPLSVEISKPIYDAEDVSIPAEGVPATVAAATAAAAVTAASDASMRDLHAGLHACISQLVATMKLTTGQLGNTLLNTEAARAIDPLFLRTLCELVRSQEEQF